jgi:hypothetical protein
MCGSTAFAIFTKSSCSIADFGCTNRVARTGWSARLEYRRYGVQVSNVLVNGIEGSESYENKLSPTSRFVAKLIGGSMKPERIVRSTLNQVARRKRICVPDYLFPVNHLGVWFLETFRSLGGRLAAFGSSKVFDLLLNGDEVKAALEE